MSNEQAKNILIEFLEAAMKKGLIGDLKTLDGIRQSIITLHTNAEAKQKQTT